MNPNKGIILRIILKMSLNLLFKLLADIHFIAILIHDCNILLQRCFLNSDELKYTCEHAYKIGIKSDAEEHVQNR
jgi:hypothetical protein